MSTASWSIHKELNVTAEEIQNLTFSDTETLASHTKSLGYLNDYSTFLSLINQRYEAPIIDLALREYQYALFALTIGQYRHAYVGLRLFFEMSLASFYFSANELDYRLWERDQKDINWNELNNTEKGIFSTIYGRAFNENLLDHMKAFSAITQTVYRECSEYVHGNLHTHNKIPQKNEYTKTICIDWHEKAKTMHIVILFLFSVRHLLHLDSTNKTIAEPIIMSELSHISAIRDQF